MKGFNEVIRLAAAGGRKSVAVVWGSDASTLHAVEQAVGLGIATAVMVGCRDEVQQALPQQIASGLVTIVDAATPAEAATLAVSLVRQGKAQVLMKGLVNTDVLLKAVLNKENGLLPQGNILTHIAIAHIPSHRKLLFFTDAAVMPAPTHEQRIKQVEYTLAVCRALGIDCPRIALVHCSEKVDERHFPFTLGYRELAERAQRGEWGHCIIDGPLDVKTACDRHSMEVKGIKSPLAGDADALIFTDIQAGNVFYKTITLFAGASTAGMLCGTSAPVVVPSRGDSDDTKLNSIAAACAIMINQ